MRFRSHNAHLRIILFPYSHHGDAMEPDDLACMAKGNDRKTTSVEWPRTVDAKLERLFELARAEGERTSRSDILAALVAAAPENGEGLGVVIHSYRRMRVRDFPPIPLTQPLRGRRPS